MGNGAGGGGEESGWQFKEAGGMERGEWIPETMACVNQLDLIASCEVRKFLRSRNATSWRNATEKPQS